MTRLLVTGASGLLGLNLALAAGGMPAPGPASLSESGYQVTGLVHSHGLSGTPFPVRRIDLNASVQVTKIIEETRPEIIINCAAVANLDVAEADPVSAWRMNADLPGWLAKECASRSIRLMHISTDAVFDGQRGEYTEQDLPDPLSVYARSKLAGEKAVLESNPQAVVARVNFFGWSISGQRSLAEWFLNNLTAGHPVKGFTDVFFCPLLVNQLVGLLLEMIEKSLTGLYHVVSRDHLSKYAFGQALARQFCLDENLISPASSQEAGLAARRSPNLTLRTDKLAAALGITLPNVASGIAQFYDLYSAGFPQRLKAFRD